MSFRKFITSRTFIINLALAIVLTVLLLTATLFALKNYTHHGISYQVPDFTGMSVERSTLLAQQSKVEIQVIDSIFDKAAAPGAVVDQVPKGGKRVKEGRVVFLTINSNSREKVALPKLTDISFRQAKVMLENSGLGINTITYQASEYNDLVLNVLQDSIEVHEGDRLLRGSSVDLVIGQSKGNIETQLPQLSGMFIDDAKAALSEARLNVGVLIYDESISSADDTLNARIWKQMPSANTVRSVYQGSSVDLWLTTSEDKIMLDSIPKQ